MPPLTPPCTQAAATRPATCPAPCPQFLPCTTSKPMKEGTAIAIPADAPPPSPLAAGHTPTFQPPSLSFFWRSATPLFHVWCSWLKIATVPFFCSLRSRAASTSCGAPDELMEVKHCSRFPFFRLPLGRFDALRRWSGTAPLSASCNSRPAGGGGPSERGSPVGVAHATKRRHAALSCFLATQGFLTTPKPLSSSVRPRPCLRPIPPFPSPTHATAECKGVLADRSPSGAGGHAAPIPSPCGFSFPPPCCPLSADILLPPPSVTGRPASPP